MSAPHTGNRNFRRWLFNELILHALHITVISINYSHQHDWCNEIFESWVIWIIEVDRRYLSIVISTSLIHIIQLSKIFIDIRIFFSDINYTILTPSSHPAMGMMPNTQITVDDSVMRDKMERMRFWVAIIISAKASASDIPIPSTPWLTILCQIKILLITYIVVITVLQSN